MSWKHAVENSIAFFQSYLLLQFLFKSQNDQAFPKWRNPTGEGINGKHGSWKEKGSNLLYKLHLRIDIIVSKK